jgi:hypothetical protein
VAKLPGKFARFQANATTATGAFRWGASFTRERLDTTTFESAVSASGLNLHTDGTTGPLDSKFTVEGWIDDAVLNLFFPDAALTCHLLFRKNVSLGYKNVVADVLDFGPATAVREVGRFTAQLQSSGLVNLAA